MLIIIIRKGKYSIYMNIQAINAMRSLNILQRLKPHSLPLLAFIMVFSLKPSNSLTCSSFALVDVASSFLPPLSLPSIMLAAFVPCSLSSSVFLEKGKQKRRENDNDNENDNSTQEKTQWFADRLKSRHNTMKRYRHYLFS